MKNIVIVMVDAFRPKNLSMFGYPKETDKNLKKIAKESILFLNHVSTSNSTAPALTSIFTGKYPSTHRIIHQIPFTTDKEIDEMEKNLTFWLPSYLKSKGYRTLAVDWFGFWFKNGFDYYEEKEEKQSYLQKLMRTSFVHKFSLNLPSWAYKLGRKLVKTRAFGPFHSSKETADLAISKIKELKEANEPFFLFVHFWDTHFPYPNTKYRAKGYANDIEETLRKMKNKNLAEYLKKRISDTNLHSFQDIINKYDLTLENIDKEIGRIHKCLKKKDLLDNTIFVILGDHGQNLTEHGIYFNHSGIYEDSVHVPLIMRIPGISGRETNELVQNVDIAPTILDCLGLKEEQENFDGKSLLPLINEGKIVRDKAFLFDGLCPNTIGIRTKNRKLIVSKDGACYLSKTKYHKEIEEFDLEKDPGELKDIYSENSELKKLLGQKGL